jgi:hypothetical protein
MDRLADCRLGTYRAAYQQSMSVAALDGFSGGRALFHWVLPRAPSLDPVAVARAARAVQVPTGSLPNGSGLALGPPGGPGPMPGPTCGRPMSSGSGRLLAAAR